MYGTIRVFNQNNEAIKPRYFHGKVDEHIAACITIFFNLLGEVKTNPYSHLSAFDQSYIPAELKKVEKNELISTFLAHLYHGSLIKEMEVVRDENHPAHLIAKKAFECSQLSNGHLAFSSYLQTFSQPGSLKYSVIVQTFETANQRLLKKYGYPIELVPEEFKCALSGNMMDTPAYNTANRTPRYEERFLRLYIEDYGLDPTNQCEAENSETVVDNEHYTEKTKVFLEKIALLHRTFGPESAVGVYRKYQKLIADHEYAFDNFEVFFQAKKAYQDGINLYHQQNYCESISKFNLASTLFSFINDIKSESECYYNIAICHVKSGEYSEAKSACDSALSCLSKDTSTRHKEFQARIHGLLELIEERNSTPTP